jgi:Zn-finger nucleic acid-binding protein
MVQTTYGDVEIPELVRCYELWRGMITKQNEIRRKYNQTEEGKTKNREKAKDYYEKHKQEILQKRKAYRDKKKSEYMMLD